MFTIVLWEPAIGFSITFVPPVFIKAQFPIRLDKLEIYKYIIGEWSSKWYFEFQGTPKNYLFKKILEYLFILSLKNDDAYFILYRYIDRAF